MDLSCHVALALLAAGDVQVARLRLSKTRRELWVQIIKRRQDTKTGTVDEDHLKHEDPQSLSGAFLLVLCIAVSVCRESVPTTCQAFEGQCLKLM